MECTRPIIPWRHFILLRHDLRVDRAEFNKEENRVTI